MSRRIVLTAALATGALVLAGGLLLWRGATSDEPSQPSTGWAERTVKAGEVTVKVRPERLDPMGASFRLTFDTHTVALNFDVAKAAHLEVDGAEWSGARWSGDTTGGHHREGTLAFSAPPNTASPTSVTLHLSGLEGPVTAQW